MPVDTQIPICPSETGSSHRPKRFYLIAKRLTDILISLIAGVVLLIPMLIVALLIRLESPGPAIYIHHRIGKEGKPLPLLKFRSMYLGAEDMIDDFTPDQRAEWEQDFKLNNDPRVTKIGAFLRRSSIDELPQLLNVLRGELSIVGPRPVITEELERYGPNKEKFLSVTPGLTGYWQAYARSSCTYAQRMEMELYYVDHANFWWDLRIIFATVGAVLKGHGAK